MLRTCYISRPRLRRLFAALAVAGALAPAALAGAGTIVRFSTTLGSFDVQLFDGAMPRSVTNFLHYVNSSKYNGTVVHRNSDSDDGPGGTPRDFVIQGGGFSFQDPTPPTTTVGVTSVTAIAPIADEPGGGVAGPSNIEGTIAFAKSGPNTVTSQWFINQGNNSFLDNPNRGDGGFAAFGRVLGNGMNVVNAIGDLRTLTDPEDDPEDDFDAVGPNYIPKADINPVFWDLPVQNFTGSSITGLRAANTVTVTNVRTLNLLTGDFDRNGLVNAADLTILKANYGLASGAFLDKGDADMNGRVDGLDFLLWQRNSGRSNTPIAAAPEPASAALAFLAVGVAGAMRRHKSWRR